MVPLEQYDDQLAYSTLWGKLYGPLRPQLDDKLWYDLSDKLWEELEKECLGVFLKEELEHQCL